MGGGGIFPEIPDWIIYKVGPHTPELEQNARMLSSLGLHDPWARNEVRRLLSKEFFPGLRLAIVTHYCHCHRNSLLSRV